MCVHCYSHSSGDSFAVKSIDKRRIADDSVDRQCHNNEAKVMTILSPNPNVLRIFDDYEDDDYLHIVLELCTSDDLYRRITSRVVSESEAVSVLDVTSTHTQSRSRRPTTMAASRASAGKSFPARSSDISIGSPSRLTLSPDQLKHCAEALRFFKTKRASEIGKEFSILQDNPSDKDVNQGTLVVFNLDSSVANDELRQIFSVYGEIKEIRETPHRSHHKFVEFYDIRAADAALRALNKSDIAGKRIKIEASRPGGTRR